MLEHLIPQYINHPCSQVPNTCISTAKKSETQSVCCKWIFIMAGSNPNDPKIGLCKENVLPIHPKLSLSESGWKQKIDEYQNVILCNFPFTTEIFERTRDVHCFEPVWNNFGHPNTLFC